MSHEWITCYQENVDETDKKASEFEQLPPHSPLEKFDFGVLTQDPFESVSTERVMCTPHDIYGLFVSDLEVPIKPTLLTVAGLPGCDKSKSLMTMLSQAVATKNEAMGPLSRLKGKYGMRYCELAAAVSYIPWYSEATKNTCYLYAMEFSINEYYFLQSKLIDNFDNLAPKDGFFKDTDLASHFGHIFQRLSDNHKIPFQSRTWQKAIPNGLVLINIWDIHMTKSIFHFLPALWGHLDSSYLWLFLDIDQDKNNLHQLPSIPEGECYKNEDDGELLMRYRSSIYYLLRYVMLVKSQNKEDRRNVCSVFAMNKTGNLDDIYNVEGQIMDMAMHMGVRTSIREHMIVLQREKNEVNILKSTLDSILQETLSPSEKIPLSFVFLRSLFYELKRIYITRDELQSKGNELNMSDGDLDKFCTFFMSSGSIIDISKIDKNSPYVIVRPMKFSRELDKIFYPQSDIDSKITEYGLVTQEKAIAIFKNEYQFFMDVLVSVDLAIKLTGNQINFEGSPLPCNQAYYYMPDVRVKPPNLTCDPAALNLLMDINCPLCHLQVIFAKAYFAICQKSTLDLNKDTPVNVTSFRTEPSSGNIGFQLKYRGDAIEILLPKSAPLADEATCVDIVNACNRMMKKDTWLKSRYVYAAVCLEHDIITDAKYEHHILPHDGHCNSCTKDNKYLDIWNRAINRNKIPVDRVFKKATLKKKHLGVVQDLEGTKEQKKRLESQVKKEWSEELQATATLKKKYLGVVQDLECTKEQKKRLESQVKELSEELQQATESKDSQSLLEVIRKMKPEDLRGITSILTEDEEETEVNKDHQRIQERETLEEENPEENPKSDIYQNEKQEEVQEKTVSKNEEVKELKSQLEIAMAEVKELKAKIQEKQSLPTNDINPDDLHVAAQKVFHIKGNTLDWGDYGLKMYFPQGTIPSEVLIKALVGGKFQFPDGMELVSALYVISFAEELLQPVELELQHCVCLESSVQFKYLSFIAAPIDESVPPYKFEFKEGGKFNTNSQYGVIACSKFCLMGIGKKTDNGSPHMSFEEEEEEGEEEEEEEEEEEAVTDSDSVAPGDVQVIGNICCPDNGYTGQIYYINKGMNRWHMEFVVVQKIKLFIKYLEEKYSTADRDETFSFCFNDSVNGYIELNFTKPQTRSNKGWEIEPHRSPVRIRKEDADLFGHELPIPPSCLVTVCGKLSYCQDTQQHLNYSVPLIGINSDEEEIRIDRFLETDPCHSLKTVAMGIFGVLVVILLCLLLIGTITKSDGIGRHFTNDYVTTKSDRTGGFIPDDAFRTLLHHLSAVANTQLFCINLGLAQTECEIIITQFENIDDQKVKILKKWLDIAKRTWKDFIRPFVMLKYCVKANELAKEHSVHFENGVILSKCPDINNHVEL